MNNQHDLSMAYSPGVAVPCMAIHKNPADALKYTCKGNMVAVISNGTAVLGLGNIGALASKPVMEGKAVLFSKFAGIESVDICVDAKDPDDFINCVRFLSPSFGGINLEDIKAPDCFHVFMKGEGIFSSVSFPGKVKPKLRFLYEVAPIAFLC